MVNELEPAALFQAGNKGSVEGIRLLKDRRADVGLTDVKEGTTASYSNNAQIKQILAAQGRRSELILKVPVLPWLTLYVDGYREI